MKIKIFEDRTVREELKNALEWCKKNNGHIADLDEIKKLKKEGKIPDQWYDTSWIELDGVRRKATLKELKDIEKVYENGGRVLFLYNNFSGLIGHGYLINSGRFVGVAKEKQENV